MLDFTITKRKLSSFIALLAFLQAGLWYGGLADLIPVALLNQWNKIKTGRNGELTKELWIDRRESSKSLTWSSVLLAFEKTEGKPLVERPKALGDIRGVAYIYGMFYRFGLIEVPVKQDEPRSDPTS